MDNLSQYKISEVRLNKVYNEFNKLNNDYFITNNDPFGFRLDANSNFKKAIREISIANV